MISLDRDALLCDMAETYHIYSFYELPTHTIATLAAGLRDDARIRMKASNVPIRTDTLISAAIYDRIGEAVAGLAGGKAPASLVDELCGISDANTQTEPAKPAIRAYSSGDDFDKAREKLLAQSNASNVSDNTTERESEHLEDQN